MSGLWFACRHQFSWPRRRDDGDYYQVCLECGVQYAYDWQEMRRTARLDETVTSPITPKKANGSGWQPRERRLRIVTAVEYREKERLGEWRHGTSVNISRSGLLFEADEPVALETTLELVFQMPAEICGSAPAYVLCQARVARVVGAEGNQKLMLAAAINDYVYLPKERVG